MTKFHLTIGSSNGKTGPIPVSTTSKDSCPTTCPFYNQGCYAKNGPLNLHWNKVGEERGISEDQFLKKISSLPKFQLWRHNQAGDLPHKNGNIVVSFLKKLCRANRRKHGFTYTHHLLNRNNLKAIRDAIKSGFTINISANSISEAVKIKKKYNLPVACVVPSKVEKTHFEKDGVKFLVCPATYRKNIQCSNCGLCQIADRKHVVAFPAHGTQFKKVEKLIENL